MNKLNMINSTFNELLENVAISINHQNLQKQAVEMFKIFKGLSPEILNEVFQFREEISKIRQRSQFHISSAHSVFNGAESLKFLGPKI